MEMDLVVCVVRLSINCSSRATRSSKFDPASLLYPIEELVFQQTA